MLTIKKETAAIINSLLQIINNHIPDSQNDSEQNEDNTTSVLKEQLEYEKSKYLDNDFIILFAGEIKTGKSSLVNNIISEDVCTVNPGVCTNVNTIVRYGAKEKYTVYFERGEDGVEPLPSDIRREQVKDYVSEKHNKNNKKNVRLIDIKLPADILKDGSKIIDTPGLGSLNPYHAATTFSMAPKADVLIFVSSADSEFSEDEKDYLKKLIDCSNCSAIVHVLTNADNGDPSTILKKNDLYINQIIEGKDILYFSCSVSNTNYEKYRGGEKISITDTGFDILFEHIERIKNLSLSILTKRVLALASEIIMHFREDNRILLGAMGNPEIARKRKNELEEVENRITELKNNSDTWRIKLQTKISQYKNHVDSTVKSRFDSVKSLVEEKLSDDNFIKTPEKLGPIVSAEIVTQTTSVERSLQSDLEKIYEEICEESGLKLIREKLHPIRKPDENPSINRPNVDKLLIYRNAVGGRMFAYGLVGSVIGSILGAIIGTVTIPGVGTVLGAELGSLIAGAITTVGIGIGLLVAPKKVRQAKRDKVMGLIGPKITKIQSQYLVDVKDAISKAEEGIRISFNNAIKAEDKSCKSMLNDINAAILGDESRRETLNKENRSLEMLSAKVITVLDAL